MTKPLTYSVTPEMRGLFKAILTLKTEEEAARFFRDLLTLPELKEFANRWEIIKQLLAGTPYAEIAKKLGVSTTTVTRCAQWLNNGEDGYQLVAKRLKYVKNPLKK